MDEIDAVPSNSKHTESAEFEAKNGISMLPCCIKSDFKFESQNTKQLHKIIFNTGGHKRIRELVLTHSDLQNLPSSFILNLGNLIHLNLEDNKLSQLPLIMRKLLKLQHLNISHNCFKALSEDIGNLIMLQTLRLENNSLVDLPENICNLMNLRELSIANNSLKTLPNGIGKLAKLEHLDISGNLLEDLPKSMFQLTNLCHFNAASNKLSYLSESFTHLNKLRTLNLAHNVMYEVPYCLFTGLPNVSELDLSHNYIRNFSEAPNCTSKLRRLKLDYNSLLTLPQWIFRDTCKCLLKLDISCNKYMNGISNEIYSSASNLKMLDLSNCALSTTSVVFLHRLKSLEYLNMGNYKYRTVKHKMCAGNIFWDLPIGELKKSCHLQVLILCNVGLAAISEDIIQLKVLQYLDLSSNKLHWLPNSFSDLVNLKSCHLSNNTLAVLPVQLGNLEGLKELSLDGNQLHSLPESMAKLQHLELLDLYDNTLEEVPEVLRSMPSLKSLDLEWNCFDVLQSLKDDNFLDRYIQMKCSMRSRLTGFLSPRMDCKRPPLECDSPSLGYELCVSADYPNSSNFSEEMEREDFSGLSHCTSDINREEEEENWDLSDDINDSFDPSFLPTSQKKKVRHQRALIVMGSLISSPDNFCPADVHVPPVKTLGRSKRISALSFQAVEGQFDDIS
ncbi:hypothetical protein B7P43_G01832 [Cryptotermes secundus]|uniref:Disease resistance R13L4/SHOC-2-like LRR domain-containing protein n=1 Tax=Cryptotermes secundus TaxID=105785 RepID=A0A2J7QWC3_9NEOP|nr:hypothetical protein B7P43_G01832 [Cryptotermes secundus]